MSSLENPGNIQPESAEPKKTVKEKGVSLLRPIIATLVSLTPGAFPVALLIAGMYGKGKGGYVRSRLAAVIMTAIATGASMSGNALVAAFFIAVVLAHAAWSNRSDKVTVTISSIGALVALSTVFEAHHSPMSVFGVVMATFVLQLQQFFLWKAQQQDKVTDGEQQDTSGMPKGVKELLDSVHLGAYTNKVEEAWKSAEGWRLQASYAWQTLQGLVQQIDAKRAELAELDRELAAKRGAVQQQPGHSTMELKLPADGVGTQQPAPPMPSTPPPGSSQG